MNITISPNSNTMFNIMS